MKSSDTQSLDRWAIFLSGLCLAHCLAVPLALLAGGLFGGWLDETETEVHWLLLGLAAPVSLFAFYRGFRRHRSVLTPIIGCTGLLLMLAGVSHVFHAQWEVGLTVAGVALVLVAHLRNVIQHRHGT